MSLAYLSIFKGGGGSSAVSITMLRDTVYPFEESSCL